MSIVRLTKEFHFEMAHSLLHYDGPCRHIHGHSYRLYVTISGSPVLDEHDPKNGMLIDFGDLKNIVDEEIIGRFDHCTVFSQTAYNEKQTAIKDLFTKIEVLDFQPTCENFVVYFAKVLADKFKPGIKLVSIKLYETATSYAEWYATDQI